jgi:DNA polymerase I
MNANDNILIVDGFNTFKRVFAVNSSVNSIGEHVGGIVGFLYSLRKAINIINPSRCIIVFDGKDGSKYRRKIYPEYKMNRRNKHSYNRHKQFSTGVSEEQQIINELRHLITYLEVLPLNIISIDGIEADDTIAYIVNTLSHDKNKTTIMSTDKDFYQLINDNVIVWSPTKNILVTKTEVNDEFGIIPDNFIVLKTLIGDNSDNISGIKGAGSKTVKKYFPELFTSDVMDMKEFFKYAKECSVDSKLKIHDNVINNIDILKRNYILMQLKNPPVNNRNKLKITNIVNGDIPELIKYKLQVTFLQDNLSSNIKNFESFIRSFNILHFNACDHNKNIT